MHTPPTNMDAQRLCGAADLLLEGIASLEGMNTFVPAYPDEHTSNNGRHYTLPELVEAMSMLMRLGLVPTRKKAHSVDRDVHPSHQSREERRIEVDGENRRLAFGAGLRCARAHGPRARQ